jgi:hypothetical protein
VIALGAVGAIASTAIGAGQRPWTPRACSDDATALAAAVQSARPIGVSDLGLETWFRMDPQLDRAGVLQGQRLALGVDGDRSSWVMDLPAESFAAGPFGLTVLVGTDDGSTSRLEVADVKDQCSWALSEESDVIRRATIDPTGTTIYEMRVDRDTRADLGIWSRPLDGSSAAVRVLEPIGADDRFGRTFTTEFSWELSGSGLAVQSCGEAACRTRVFDPAGGKVRTVAEPELGVLVGFESDVLVTYAACPGFPCRVVGTDLTTGDRSILAEAGAVAVLVATADGPRVVHEQIDETGTSLRTVTLDGTPVGDVGFVPDGVGLHPLDGSASAATRVPPGWVLLSPDGRLPADGPDGRTQLRHVPDGAAVQLEEVAR